MLNVIKGTWDQQKLGRRNPLHITSGRGGRGKDLGKWQRKILGKNQDKSDDRSVNKSDDG